MKQNVIYKTKKIKQAEDGRTEVKQYTPLPLRGARV
jgi:hypothetical protein